MKRRIFITSAAATVSLLRSEGSGAQSTPGATHTIVLRRWSFQIPEDWKEEQGRSSLYFESPDGSKGCYVITLQLDLSAEHDASRLAASMQRAHRRSHAPDADYNWRVMRESESWEGTVLRSSVDSLDGAKMYRVLSEVLAIDGSAVRLALHDYHCDNYGASVEYFAPIAASLRLRKDA